MRFSRPTVRRLLRHQHQSGSNNYTLTNWNVYLDPIHVTGTLGIQNNNLVSAQTSTSHSCSDRGAGSAVQVIGSISAA